MIHVAVPLTQRLERVQDQIKSKTLEIRDLENELKMIIHKLEQAGVEAEIEIDMNDLNVSLKNLFDAYAKAYPNMDIPLLCYEDFETIINEHIRN